MGGERNARDRRRANPIPGASWRGDAVPLDEDRLREAQMLKDEARYADAAAIYAEQAKLQPANAWLFARQAELFDLQARREADPAQARALAKRARSLAEQAEQLGTSDPLTPLILQSIQPDGSRRALKAGDFSQHEEADRLIREGEAAFGRHDFPKARECYQRAAELEPTNCMATLWTGDAHFAARELEPACTWFRKAIALEPDNELAHRYLGDALEKLGRREEAMNEHIEALLCEPYQRVTRQHFTAELRAVAEAKGRRIPRFGVGGYSVDATKKEIGISREADNLHAVYALACANWRIENFGTRFPQEMTPRRSLPEEMAGLDLLIATHDAIGDKGELQEDEAKAEIEKWRPVLSGLGELKREGLLEAYALFERVDADLAKDYAAYRAEHRDTLERYIRVYWCGFE